MRATLTSVGAAVLLAALVPGQRAAAVPAFARAYRASCTLCHDPIPRLSAYGKIFLGNGYRFSPGRGLPDDVPTGDPLLALPAQLRLAMRFDAYAVAYAGGNVVTDLQTPFAIKGVSGGPLSDHLSYYVSFMLSERGATGGIEDAFATWNEVGGAPVSVSVGQFQVSAVIFPRELRLERQDFVIYRARVGTTPVDLTYHRGLLVGADLAGFAITGGVVNGNGSSEAQASGRFDDDRHKSLMAHVSRDLPGGLSLGVMGYLAHQSGAASGGPAAVNRLWMLGADATVALGPVELRGQYLYRRDTSPTFTPGEALTRTAGGFAEALWHPEGSRWYALALYNRVRSSRPLLDVGGGHPAETSRYETLTAGGGYLLRRNLRTYAEVTWDAEMQKTQWTLGTTMAF